MGRTIGGIASSSVATWRSFSSSFVLARQDIKVAKRDQLSLFPSFLEDTCLLSPSLAFGCRAISWAGAFVIMVFKEEEGGGGFFSSLSSSSSHCRTPVDVI